MKNNDSGDEDGITSEDDNVVNTNDQNDKKIKKGRRRTPRVIKKPIENDTPQKEREPPFHDSINEAAKEAITGKGIELGQKMTIDVAIGDTRIKLGQGGYAGLAHSSGMVGEGTYICNENGVVTFDWERCLEFIGGSWTSGSTSKLMTSLSLTAGKFLIFLFV